LVELPSLQILDVHNNKLQGSLPGEIKPNTALKLLSLYGNNFNGSIPDSISNFQSLFHLDLSSNQFSGRIPVALSNLTSLQRLYLSNNRFSAGSIPAEFQRLTNLSELSLKDCTLSGPIPSFLGDLQNLVLLDLGKNNLNGSVPSQIGELRNLQFLLLNRNEDLEGPVPDTFGQLSDLRVVLLDRTSLNGTLEVVCNLPTFKEAQGDSADSELITSDCDSEIDCKCCTSCCRDDDPDSCKSLDTVSNLSPEWQFRYDRVEFQFGDSEDFVDFSNTAPSP
jgi:hypothetical protein